jgi:chemosensory pili system protein ChpA (sensor histidine kinase/response regulator)
MSGFSTRQTISELSGRGVGMDVVREWVASMSGSIRVSSRTGEGCTIEMRFAASLSTMHSLIVDVAGQRFALPSIQVEQAVPRGVGAFEILGDKLVYRHKKRVLPARKLAQAAAIGEREDKPWDAYDAVIVRVDDKAVALAVDRLLDSRELLVKSPGRYARHVRGVAGLSVLGDGSMAVNLDVAALLDENARPAFSAGRIESPAQLDEGNLPGVLVVDDSLSVRNSLMQLAQDAGYRVVSARDGVDAIDSIASFKPDVVLTDLEMPNMNGLELTAHIRSREELKELPVIMVTSRSQERHRRMAEEAGVSSYVTKPYNEADLLDRIRQALILAA